LSVTQVDDVLYCVSLRPVSSNLEAVVKGLEVVTELTGDGTLAARGAVVVPELTDRCGQVLEPRRDGFELNECLLKPGTTVRVTSRAV
jgi:hypothetical protein